MGPKLGFRMRDDPNKTTFKMVHVRFGVPS